MRVLLHICCGPCAIMPIKALKEAGRELTGFFYNPNIHPLKEYLLRRAGAVAVAEKLGIPLHCADSSFPYNLQDWLNMTHAAMNSPHPQSRCPRCWEERLRKSAAFAAVNGFDAFTSSLLYSRRQRHEEIAAQGEQLGKEYGVPFFYQDFRPLWQQGIDLSKEWGIYRQQHCGCIYSENERYARELEKAVAGSQ